MERLSKYDQIVKKEKEELYESFLVVALPCAYAEVRESIKSNCGEEDLDTKLKNYIGWRRLSKNVGVGTSEQDKQVMNGLKSINYFGSKYLSKDRRN